MTSESILCPSFSPVARVHADSRSSETLSVPKEHSATMSASLSAINKGAGTSVSDEELLVRVGTGDREALSTLFQKHAKAVFNVGRRILRDSIEAEDLVQDVFIRLFQKGQQYDPCKGKALSWIIQITYCCAFDRRDYLMSRHYYSNAELHADLTPDSKPPDRFIGALIARDILKRLRNELSAGEIRLLELYLIEGYTFHEIAERSGRTFGSIRNQYYRAVKRLQTASTLKSKGLNKEGFRGGQGC